MIRLILVFALAAALAPAGAVLAPSPALACADGSCD